MEMDPLDFYLTQHSRRQFLGKSAMGLGGVALTSMLD